VIAAFVLLYFLIEGLWRRDQNPAQKLGFLLVVSIVIGTAIALLSFFPSSGFDAKNYLLIPLGFDSIVMANVVGAVLGTLMLVMLLSLRDIIFSKRRKGTRRNFLILVGCAAATALSTLSARPMESSFLSSLLLGLTVVAMLMNSFRLSWIVYLSKREKLFSMLYGFLLFGILVGFDYMVWSKTALGKSLLFYSPPLQSFVSVVFLFSTIYFGMTFLSTLFHLPTAEAFDRKISEVASLHNLGRLVTQVFDFNELVDSVTRMTLEVCQAQSSWLEIIKEENPRKALNEAVGTAAAGEQVEPVGLKNISREEILGIVSSKDGSLRDLVLDTLRPVVIDDVGNDKRTAHLRGAKRKFESMVIVPLLSHNRAIGILYATKGMPFGFDQEDIGVISAFADQATIAIENSRLIEKSLERERLMREIMVAQEMQKKLLPQKLPVIPGVEIEALSSPAFEVGGDYYDFVQLDEHNLGIIVGDVSGKGVSAAFYMAEMKGIFQCLSKIHPSPRDFLAQAHSALSATIDKRSFISVIYAVLDLRDGTMTVARAGHCPMLHVSDGAAVFIRPTGMGLGIGTPAFFEQTVEQERIQMSHGDVAVFFTDGVTEARPSGGEEFGYERLLEIGKTSGIQSAVEIRDAIIMAVDRHMNHQSPEDDLTLVVIKWLRS
jgi:serine phosphatase RsbU (regulator of sigma subunit)